MQDRRERRRRDRNSLRGIWQGIWRNHPEQEGGHGHGALGSAGSGARGGPGGVLRQLSLEAMRLQRGSQSSEAPGSSSSRLHTSPFAGAEPSPTDYQVCAARALPMVSRIQDS